MKTLYNKTQYSTLIIVIFIPILAFLFYAYFSQAGDNPLPLISFIILMVLFVLVLLIFYKLNITITKDKIIATFGIGIIKRVVNINDIDINTIEKVSFGFLTGIGIRITKKGWLWNVKIGDAIYFQTKNKSATFLVGTDDYYEIKKLLKN